MNGILGKIFGKGREDFLYEITVNDENPNNGNSGKSQTSKKEDNGK